MATKKLNALELFSGSQSVGKVLVDFGYNVISLDINDYNGKLIPTHKEDIMTFNYKQYPKDYFSIIHCSPPCVFYSLLQRPWIGRYKKEYDENFKATGFKYLYTEEIHQSNLEKADGWVKKCIEIIEYFLKGNPNLIWAIENPQTSILKKRGILDDYKYFDCDYCMYSDWGYRKRTRFWTNITTFIPKLCDRSGKCGNMVTYEKETFHKSSFGNSKQRKRLSKYKKHIKSLGGAKGADRFGRNIGGGANRLLRYRIPPKLIKELYNLK